VNTRVGGTASHTLHATCHDPATAEPTKWFTLASWCKLPRSRLAPKRLGAWACMEKPKNQANRFSVRASQRPAKVFAVAGILVSHVGSSKKHLV
jgi:hypothetical protein